MNTTTISLPPDLESFVQAKVQSGGYQTENEVVREALRLLRERDRVREMRRAELRREIELGLEDSRRGDVAELDIEEIKAEGRKKLARKQS
jgi:antitoxin ParD1/3/4